MRLNVEGKQKEQQWCLNSTSQSDNRHQLWDREEVCQAPMKAQRTVPACFLKKKKNLEAMQKYKVENVLANMMLDAGFVEDV